MHSAGGAATASRVGQASWPVQLLTRRQFALHACRGQAGRPVLRVRLFSRSLLALLLLSAPAWAQSLTYGVGRTPTPEEIREWDSSIAPDGAGLPKGSGTAAQGQEVYANRCSRCHGARGEGGDNEPLVGGVGSLAKPKPLRTVGSYWPYATTIWDYINRAMPFNQPGILSHDQVYQLTAVILYLNGIIGENDVMNAKTLPQVKMPNRNGFVPDPRPDIDSAKNSAAKKAAPKVRPAKTE